MYSYRYQLSDITNWQHIGGGPLWQQMLPPPCLISQFSFVVLVFFRFCSNQQLLATKTAIVLFKQHDSQIVADLNGVAGDHLIAPQHHQTQKKLRFLGIFC